MNETIYILAAYAPAIVCVTFAGLIAHGGGSGWGWFLLMAALLFPTGIKSRKHKDETK